MKKLVLLLTIISHFAFGQNNAPQYNSTTKKTTQYTGVVTKAPVWSATDTTSGKSSVYQFETNRIKYKNQRIETDTSKFDKVNVGKGDSAFWVSKKLISGSGAIDTLKVGRIEQGRGTTAGSMYFNGVSWVKNDTSYIPREGASNISGNLKSNQSYFTTGLATNNNFITFLNEVNTEIKSASSTSDTRIGAYSTSNGYADISVYNPSGGLYDRRFLVSGTGNNTPDQSFRIQNGLLYYFGDYTAQMTNDRTVPDIGKVKQLISDSIAGSGGLTSVYSANSDILVDSSITGKRKLTLNKTLTSGYINIGDGTNTAFPRAISGDATISNLGALLFSNVNSNVGTFGGASKTTTKTVNAKGLVTAISEQNIAIAESQVTNLTSDLSTLTSNVALKANIASPTFTGTVTIPSGSVMNTPASIGLSNATGLPLATGVTGLLPDANIASASTWNSKQAALISGSNIRTVNGSTLLGSTNLAVGDALVANPLSQFSSTTSAQLAGVMSDEAGSGLVVFNNAPSLTNPDVTTQARSINSTKAASTAFVLQKAPYTINVKDYGAVGDGVTNDAAAINAAIAAASAVQTVFFPDGNYLIGSTSISVNKAVNILGGFASITVTGNVPAIVITANNVKIEHIRIIGSGKASGSTAQHGISSDGYYYMGYRMVECYNMGGAGIYIKNTNVSGARYGARMTECYFNGNNIGYLADISAEYITATNCYFQYNNSGVIIRAGNNSFSGGSISDNLVVGVKLEGSTLNPLYVNDGHGVFSGVLINHNATKSAGVYVSGYNLYIDGITLGYTFSGCHFYDSKIYLKNCVGVTFGSCQLAFISIDLEGSLGTMVNGCTLYRGYGFTINNNFGGVQSQTNWANSRSYSGIAGSYLENVYGGYFNGAVAAGTSIPTGNSNIDFAVNLQSTGGNLTQTQYVFYSATNKTIKNFGLGDNKVKINFNLNVSIGVLADPSKLLVTLDLYDTDGTTFVGTIAILPYIIYDETSTANRQMIFSLQGVYGIEPNKHFRIGVVNNTTYTATVATSVLGANNTSNGFNRIFCEGL